MIKQSWNIGEEERKRILNLHETATKKQYLFSEQTISPSENENVLGGNDKNDPYRYLIFQPSTSNRVEAINWEDFYCVVAFNPANNTAYVAQPQEENQDGIPTKFKVETDRVIPYFNYKDISENQFKFGFIKTDKKGYRWNYEYDEITKKSLVLDTKDGKYYLVNMRGNFALVKVLSEIQESWSYTYSQEGILDFRSMEIGKEYEMVPSYNIVVDKRGTVGLIVPSTFGFYPLPKAKTTPDTPTTGTTLPPPSNFGDDFADNVSFPSNSILQKPEYQKFVKFVKSNDMSKYIFRIQASASKCTAKSVEGLGKVKWKNDKTDYPDVVVDSNADKTDIGNLNLTKARAQHLKDFLLKNLPELKNAQFEVIAQGSIGGCGTEEENKKLRIVRLSVLEK